MVIDVYSHVVPLPLLGDEGDPERYGDSSIR